MVASAGISEAGPVRSNNEDYFFVDDTLGLYVVADGMGGHAAGEVASRIAVETIAGFIRRPAPTDGDDGSAVIDPPLSPVAIRLRTAVQTANRSIWQAAARHAPYAGMGTTIVCAVVTGDRLTIAHAGDSRLYILSGSTLTAETQDDTWAAAFPGGARAGETCMADHPFKHVLTNVLGGGEQPTVHLRERTLSGGETLLLCTDGVHNVLDEQALLTILSGTAPVDALARTVVHTALQRGSRDNATAVVVRYTPEGPQAAGGDARGSMEA